MDLPGLPPLESVSVASPRAAVRLRAMLFAAGHEDRRPSAAYDWDGRRRGEAEFGLIQLTLGGTGRLDFNDHTYTLRPGDAMVLSFPHDHRYWRPTNRHWRFLYACIHGGEAMRIWRDAAERRGPVWRLSPESRLVEALAETCRRAIDRQINDPYVNSALAYQLAMAVLKESAAGEPEPGDTPRSAAIARAVRYAQQWHRQPIGVEDLAEAAGMSRYHFSRVFRRSEGRSPGRYLADLRVASAVRLLQTTDDTLEKIANATGFANASHLSRAVRASYDTTPGSIRQRGMYMF